MICIGPLVFHLPGRASSPARRGGSEHRNVEGGRRGQESSAHDVAGEEGEGPTRPGPRSLRYEGRGRRVGGGGQIAENELQRRSGGYISRAAKLNLRHNRASTSFPPFPPAAPATVLLSASRSFLRRYEAAHLLRYLSARLFLERPRTAFLFFRRSPSLFFIAVSLQLPLFLPPPPPPSLPAPFIRSYTAR